HPVERTVGNLQQPRRKRGILADDPRDRDAGRIGVVEGAHQLRQQPRASRGRADVGPDAPQGFDRMRNHPGMVRTGNRCGLAGVGIEGQRMEFLQQLAPQPGCDRDGRVRREPGRGVAPGRRTPLPHWSDGTAPTEPREAGQDHRPGKHDQQPGAHIHPLPPWGCNRAFYDLGRVPMARTPAPAHRKSAVNRLQRSRSVAIRIIVGVAPPRTTPRTLRCRPDALTVAAPPGAVSRGSQLPGFDVRLIELQIGSERYRLRVLSDLQQFYDPDGHSAQLGISCAQWSLFGQLWPGGELLARVMSEFDIEGKRFLEIGCGIGAASLVLQNRGARVVATDMHPQAEPFLAYNAALNGLPAIPYRQLDWAVPLPTLGRFDVLIASDVMYERDHARLLAGVIQRHARPSSEVVLVDSGRGGRGLFTRLLEEQGFVLEPWTAHAPSGDTRGRLRVLHFRRH